MVEIICENCGEKSFKYRSQVRKNKFCNHECHSIWLTGQTRPNDTKVTKQCITCGSDFIIKRSHANKRINCSRKCQGIWHSKQMTKYIDPNAKPSIIRKSGEYQKWSKNVKNRDGYKCVICQSNKDVVAHHIFRFWSFPQFRFNEYNGMTVCRDCHKRISQYDRIFQLVLF